ncbi:hypothetical protein COU62_01810 [Candidatus Pacearchaeota archaeon CG10_big_fil_rev_8_21_14_0_10_35_219]|nr:hypothetical protein [Candidatus Pacearchaeota archaeon]OIO42553.1 MAG: hypothetical protein AUJ63_02615 [Candidatus Pacearchaeota archaeon CG1_02_35_32]PIO07928.1 MAG: hypothetical protein COU62_01810 [Candidatus Pacearchaeota archaeon CG10_big_fil_rev_8_21_14_0_10_35_219]PIY81604.1 MAG: hypothetical protein COY79_01780 [Candidatus Pacearchaeota archaeon CG_4_10_14_0_8_um_filter_35_169]PIZ80647.1 MAG: hypothetical protein COY00_00790 [Candidatus Pacearchaeota archaeon CG_4_10_14_0_2_um_filt
MPKKKSKGIGGWSFLIGVILALILGFLGYIDQTWTWILVVIGLIVGFLNISEDETTPFLMSGAILVIVSAFGRGALSAVDQLVMVVDALLLIFVPATIVVALKHVFSMAKH